MAWRLRDREGRALTLVQGLGSVVVGSPLLALCSYFVPQ